MPAQRYDVFCKVVDNYGDAGVSWRLARQLVREHDLAVTLWIDALASLTKIAPDVDGMRDDQVQAGVNLLGSSLTFTNPVCPALRWKVCQSSNPTWIV